MAHQVETASIEATEEEPPAEQSSADVPTGPASLWASESKVHYSITHTGECDTRDWIDSCYVIHTN